MRSTYERLSIQDQSNLWAEAADTPMHIIAVLQLMTLLSLYLVGQMIHLGYWYDAGLGVGAVFFVYQLWLIRTRDRDACFRAFLNNNYFGMAVFVGMALEYLFALK